MKRLLVVLLVLAALAGGAFFLLKRQDLGDGAQVVPAKAVFYAALPDVRRSVERWPKTALASIAAEPSVAEFMKKPLGRLAQQGGMEGLDLLFRVKPGRFFVAVNEIRDTGADVLIGFQFFGSRQELDAAFDRLYRELGKNLPAARRATADYKGDVVTSFEGDGPILFTAAHGSWGFLANTRQALEQALDRVSHRDTSPSLATDAEFLAVQAELPSSADLTWFGRLKPVTDALLRFSARQTPTAVPNANQFAELEKLKAMGGTLKLDGADIREATYILYPNAPKVPVISRAPLAFTTPETTFFYDGSLDLQTIASDSYRASLPPNVQQLLAAQQIDLKQLPAILGNDLGLVINWSPSAMIPSVLASLEIRDRKAVEALADRILASTGLAPGASELGGARVLSFQQAGNPLIQPTVAIGDKFLLGSLTMPELERVLTRQPGSATLEGAASFKAAQKVYTSDVQAFAYLDSKGLFEGIYNRVRPIAMLAAVVSPDLGKFVDIEKLPETEAISRHLTPILYTTQQRPAGWLIESSGPITLSQAFFVGIVGGAAAYASQAGAFSR